MATVIFYNFILLSSTLFVWLSERGRVRFDRWVLLGIAFLLIFIPAAIRYNIGTDYPNYLRIYESSWELESYKLKEPAFYIINWILRDVEAHFQWMFVIFAFIFTAVAFKAYPRKNAWLLHFLFFSSLWFFSFNGMRQAVALSWCLLALFNFFEKRYFLFFSLGLVASAFHQSAFIVVFLGLFALIPLSVRIKGKVAPLIFIGLIAFTYVSMNIVLIYMEQILNFLGFLKYAGYFSSSKYFIERDFGSGIGVLAKILFSIYILLSTKKMLSINRNYWFLSILIFFYAVGVVLANEIIIFGRMADIFIVAPIVGGYLLFSQLEHNGLGRYVVGFFVVFLMLSFVKDSFGMPTSYADPLRNPYQTIFSK